MSYVDLKKKKSSEPKSAKDLLQQWQFDPDRMKSQKYVKHEFQDYGVRLSHDLNDPGHKSLYIKLAKTEKREFLDQAYRFAIDYPNTEGQNKGKLFMWALKKLRNGELLYIKKKEAENEMKN